MRDLLAGVVVGIVALPLALAFAIASGVPPERGLYTAIIAGFIISALGGSRVQIGGPTGAFVVIVYGIVTKFGYDGLVVCTLIAGVILVILGLARLGGLIKFIPYPVITGFTSGIAVIIFSSQVDRKSTRLNSSHLVISYAVFCLKKKKKNTKLIHTNRIDSRPYTTIPYHLQSLSYPF